MTKVLIFLIIRTKNTCYDNIEKPPRPILASSRALAGTVFHGLIPALIRPLRIRHF